MKKVILNDIIHIISGGTPKTSVTEYWENGEIGWLSINDFNNDLRRVYTSEKCITDKGLKESSTKLLEVDDIIISARGTVGVLAQIGKPMAFNQSCFGLRGKKEIVSNTYLYYCLKNYISNLKKRSQGSVFDTINLDSFKLMEIEIEESIPTQQKIAAVLSALDDKIELNNKINAELEAMAKTLYDYWFVQFEFPNADGKPYKSSGGKMVYNETLKREIPEGWEVKKLKDIAHIIMGQSPKGESYNEENKGILLINGAADYEGNYLKPRIFTSSPTRLCNKGDLVFCIRATIGKLTYAEDVYCLGRGVAAVRANEVEFTEYIFYSLNQEIERFKKHASGSIIVGITKDDLTDYFVLIPPIEILVKIHDNLKPIHSKIRLNLKQNQELAALRDWLLPMLMNGQVKVEEGIMYA